MKVDKKKFDENFERIFGKKKPNPDLDDTNRVAYKAHPETGELIPDFMWHQFGMWTPKPKLHFVVNDYDTYRCPVTDKPITGRRQHRENLNRTGCRVYEGRASEERAAASYRAQEDKKLDRLLDKSLAQTLNDIKYGNNAPPERDKHGRAKSSWTWGL